MTKEVPGFLKLPSMYFIRLSRVGYSSLLFMLLICVSSGNFPASSKAITRLVWYLIPKDSAWFFVTFLPDYVERIPVVISASLTLDVRRGNFSCSWVSL